MRPLTVSRPLAAAAAALATVLAACSSDVGDTGDTAAPSSPPRTSSSSPPSSAGGSASGSTGASAPARAGEATTLVTDLAVPWGVAFLPGGDALVSERDTHRIVRVTAQGATTTVGTVPGVASGTGEGGLLGLAVSPTFSRDRLVYAYYTSAEDNRVVRFRYTGAGLGAQTPILTGIPKAGNHDGGRIAFGPDGLLYVTAGDANQAERAPDPDYLGGKVLRMTADGEPAPGNPDPESVVWTTGHRNPQGLAFGPGGAVYEAEFGQNALDEINLLQGGNDYGWPAVEGTNGTKDGATAPLRTFPTDQASPSGLVYARGSLWLAALGGEKLYRIPLTGRTPGEPEALLDGDFGRLRTVVLAPDGALWVTTSNRDGRGSVDAGDDRILRIPLVTS